MMQLLSSLVDSRPERWCPHTILDILSYRQELRLDNHSLRHSIVFRFRRRIEKSLLSSSAMWILKKISYIRKKNAQISLRNDMWV